MPLDFPATPAVNDTFASGGRVWQWSGVKWVPASTSGSGFLLDPPADGQSYERQAGLWVPSVGFAQGFTNRLRNGGFDVWQRGTSIAAPTAAMTYTADAWIVSCTGAGLTVAQGTGRSPTLYGLSIVGAASNTGAYFWQRIESLISASLGGNVTLQMQVYNNTGATITPTLNVFHGGAKDDFTSPVSDLSVNLQPCPNAQWTRVAYTFALPQASASVGIEFQIGLGALLAGKNVVVCEADLRATPGLPTGLTAAAQIPPPELRPIGVELPYCQRYYQRWGGPGQIDYGWAYNNSATNALAYFPYKAPLRAAPTLASSTPVSGFLLYSSGAAATALSLADVGNGLQVGVTVASGLGAAVTSLLYSTSGTTWISASAEL